MVKLGKTVIVSIALIAILSLGTVPGVVNEVFGGGIPIPRTPLPSGPGPIGDFFCYIMTFDDPGLQGIVDLKDQFGSMDDVLIGQTIEFCASADKTKSDGTVVPGPYGLGQHYVSYDINMPVSEKTVSVTLPQFPSVDPTPIRVNTLAELLVPTTKFFQTNPPDLSLTDIHYKCYFVEDNVSILLPTFTLTTQFGDEIITTREHLVLLLCNPTEKNHDIFDPPTFAPGAFNNPEHLLCFSTGNQKFELTFDFQNQFTVIDPAAGPQPFGMELFNKIMFCIEALKIIPSTAVGGEIIPLDTTMVLVAGTHSVVAWMIPVIVSGIGIGIVVARKF